MTNHTTNCYYYVELDLEGRDERFFIACGDAEDQAALMKEIQELLNTPTERFILIRELVIDRERIIWFIPFTDCAYRPSFFRKVEVPGGDDND